MGVVAILVMWPGPFEQTSFLRPKKSWIWNLNLIGLMVSEKMFEIVDGRTTDNRQTPEWLVYNKLPHEPSAQVS